LSWNAWTCRWAQCGDSVASGADWLLAGDNHARNGTASFNELEWAPEWSEGWMGIIAWIVLGLIAGAIGKFLMPGRDPGGIIVTILIGIVGAVIGGFIGTSLGMGDVTGVNVWSIVLSVVGAIVLLIIYRMVTGRRAAV
jgi:uncharacterized membrane protein YeaQ/YmgE (transglycosylase-associated protein family)